MPKFQVFRRNGSQVIKGDTLTDFRNEEWTFQSCTHPRKVYVTFGDAHREFYASVLNVEIRTEDGEVTFSV